MCFLCVVVLGLLGGSVGEDAVSSTYGHHGKPKSQVRLGAQEAEAEVSQLLSEEECSGFGPKAGAEAERDGRAPALIQDISLHSVRRMVVLM